MSHSQLKCEFNRIAQSVQLSSVFLPTLALAKGLYGITPDNVPAAWIVSAAQAALAAGLKTIQLRSKHLTTDERRDTAHQLLQLCNTHGALLIINDDVALAQACGAHGVHLGTNDGDIAAARTVLGANAIIGASCYNRLDLAQAAVAAGASYVAFGAVFASPTKPHAAVAGLELFAQAAPLGVPMVAIGGINASNAGSAIAAGAHAVAVISDLFSAVMIDLKSEHTLTNYATAARQNTEKLLKLTTQSIKSQNT